MIRQSWDQKNSTRVKLQDIIEKLGQDHLEVVRLQSKDVLANHEKVVEDLRAAVSQMLTWTSVSMPSDWERLRSLIEVARNSESSVLDQLNQLKCIRLEEVSISGASRRQEALAIRRLTQRIDQRGMPASLYSWLSRHVLKVRPDDTIDLPPEHVVVEPLATESYLGPLHFSCKHDYSKDFVGFLLWWENALNDMSNALLQDVDEVDGRQRSYRFEQEFKSAGSLENVFPSGFLSCLPESKDLVDNMTGWARPVLIGMGTYAWQDTRAGNLGLGLPQIMQVVHGKLIVSIVPMKVLKDSG